MPNWRNEYRKEAAAEQVPNLNAKLLNMSSCPIPSRYTECLKYGLIVLGRAQPFFRIRTSLGQTRHKF